MTRLLRGDVQLATGYSEPTREMDAVIKPSSLKPIQIGGEQRGMNSYILNDKYTLRLSSSIRLPCIDIVAKYQFYYKALTSISTGMY
ncbi:unnamed protein product [Rotaria sp. Silwood2]|nr:unnamed protein product [Rotaria sp. Silwood2]CAF2872468.1 unnamed protein product [Rotaria sp. Silwood2]CAF3063610.1 unnamed protein product [Rotaria sp. Silwood2]CAF3289832.1 unnamed protein product [Rotaria sp. Silwood2]CAF4032571.1 unnamed protein product [Rotaria sp. Silwood2]